MTFLVFFILGITSLLSQVVIIRELLNAFYGNEFFIGLVLGSWLFWTGLGSFSLTKVISKFKPENIFKVLILSYPVIALLLPLEIFLVRFSEIWSGLPGEIPNLLLAGLFGIFAIAPVGFVLGLQFPLIIKIFAKENKENIVPNLGRGYLFETLGFSLGGIAFSFFLVRQNEFSIMFLLSILNMLAAFFVLKIRNARLDSQARMAHLSIFKIGIFIIAAAFCFSAALPFSSSLNHYTNQLRFPGQKLAESLNSNYGYIAVTKINEQYNFFANGAFLGSGEETSFNEHLVHFPLLYHPNPQKILLIGNGFNGAIKEILKYKPQQIQYVELDSKLLEIAKKYMPAELKQALHHPAVKIVNTDARHFLKNTQEKFDAVIINLAEPSTALVNRFYTREFFAEIQKHLNKNGVVSIHLPYSPNYLNKELKNLNASVYKTLKAVFPYLIILPEETNFFIASSQNMLHYEPQEPIQKFVERKIETNYINKDYIKYRLTNDRVAMAEMMLKDNVEIKINKDLAPAGYYYNLIYWLSYFYPKLSKILSVLSRVNFAWPVLIITLLFLPFFVEKKTARKKSLICVMAVAGFSLMAIEIIILVAYQIFFGYLYYRIAALLVVLMLGMALGTWSINKKIAQNFGGIKTIKKIHLAIMIYSLILIAVFLYLPKMELIFFLAAAIIGFFVGLEFPLINKLYLENGENADKKIGIIYAADSFGACLGASIPALFLIPVFGILQTLLLLAIINLLTVLLFAVHSPKTWAVKT